MSAFKKILIVVVIVAIAGGAVLWRKHRMAAQQPAQESSRASITVTAGVPQTRQWPLTIAATGSVEAWQLATIGAEISGVRIAEIDADVGDHVKKGQVLARLADETIHAALDQQRANVEKAKAALDQAVGNSKRAQMLKGTGALSDQQYTDYMTAEQSARADYNVAKAAQATQELNLGYATIIAPADGVIASRSAAVGAMVQAGTALFTLINEGRLEWRAAVTEKDIGLVKPDAAVTVMTLQNTAVTGKIRLISPTIDAATRDGLVYVSLPENDQIKQGMFLKGTIENGMHDIMALPEAAVVIQNGYSYVFTLGDGGKVAKVRVETGRRMENLVEIRGGITPDVSVAVKGAGFLNDGDTVKVMPSDGAETVAPPAPTPADATGERP
ncbi:MAG: efflux RND transporter periplasmic adaptor subunit [Micavibrio sp.]|nr:efflux RND transporter periplasmic adaptor subunit [Micavibrio sp.]